MKKKPINFVKLLRGYTSGWVGVSSDFRTVVFAGRNLKSLKAKAEKQKEKVYFFPAGKTYGNFIG